MDSTSFGTLHLESEMPEIIQDAPRWIDDKSIAIALALATVLYLAIIPLLSRILPDLYKAVFHRHGPVAFEHSIQKSRSRNFACVLLLPLDVLIIDRLELYSPAFIEGLDHWWRLAVTLAVLLGYFFVRVIILKLFNIPRLRSDELLAAQNNILSSWVLLSVIAAPLAFILLRSGLPEDFISSFFLYAAALFLALSFRQSFYILKNPCGLLPTFLYLCAFEFAPAALLILSAMAH